MERRAPTAVGRRPVALAALVLVAVLVGACARDAATTGAGGPSAPGSSGLPSATTSVLAPTPGSAPDPGAAARAARARASVVATGGTVHRVVVDGDTAAVHVETATTPPRAEVVFVRFGPNGDITGQTVIGQAVGAASVNGHTMFDGGGDPAAASDPAANKVLVARLYDEVFNGKRLDVIDEILAPDEIQHNPLIADGSAALRARMANGLPNQVREVLAQGDLVVVRVDYGPAAAADIFRVQDGRIAEHWDVLQLGS